MQLGQTLHRTRTGRSRLLAGTAAVGALALIATAAVRLTRSFARDRRARRRLHSVWTEVKGLRMHALASSSSSLVPLARRQHARNGSHVANESFENLPIVLVHGWGMSSRYLVPTAAALADRFDVLLPELPGHGESDSSDRVLDVRAQAELICDWMDARGIRRAVLLGNSMGCQTIAHIAARSPGRVAALVLVGPTADTAARRVLPQALRLIATAPFEPIALDLICLSDYRRAGPRLLVRELRYMLDDHIEETLRHIQAPVLVVRGTHDVIASQRWAAEVARAAGADGVSNIPHAAHAVNYSAPEALALLVESFLRGIARERQPASSRRIARRGAMHVQATRAKDTGRRNEAYEAEARES